MGQIRKLRPINARRGRPARTFELPPGEYWIKDPAAPELGFRLTVSTAGPAGMGITITPFVGCPELTISNPDDRYLEVCQYRIDARSQAFRRWYLEQETEADLALLGPEYRRAKRGGSAHE